MPTYAPYQVTFYGSNEFLESDSNSEVTKATITGFSDTISQAVGCYTLKPWMREDIETALSGGSVQTEITTQYQKYSIITARFKNEIGNYSDITGALANLYAVFNKKYKYLEVNTYIRTGMQSSGKLIKGVFKKREPLDAPARVYFDIEFEKERPE